MSAAKLLGCCVLVAGFAAVLGLMRPPGERVKQEAVRVVEPDQDVIEVIDQEPEAFEVIDQGPEVIDVVEPLEQVPIEVFLCEGQEDQLCTSAPQAAHYGCTWVWNCPDGVLPPDPRCSGSCAGQCSSGVCGFLCTTGWECRCACVIVR